MLLAVEQVLCLDLRLQGLGALVLARAGDRDRGAAGEVEGHEAAAQPTPLAIRIGAGVGEDKYRRLQAFRAMHGHHPDRVQRGGGVADDLDVAAAEPVEEGLQRGARGRFELERAGEQLLDRIARLRTQPFQ